MDSLTRIFESVLDELDTEENVLSQGEAFFGENPGEGGMSGRAGGRKMSGRSDLSRRPSFAPQKGDVLIWADGGTAILLSAFKASNKYRRSRVDDPTFDKIYAESGMYDEDKYAVWYSGTALYEAMSEFPRYGLKKIMKAADSTGGALAYFKGGDIVELSPRELSELWQSNPSKRYT
jgi:hypothetical protein